MENPIVNFYISGDRRIDLYVGVSYTGDLEEIEDLALEAVRALDSPIRNPDRAVEFFYEEVNGTMVIFRMRFWTNDTDQMTFLKARSEAIKAIDKTFKTNKVTFPAQNVSVDFGITGGPSLREQLEGINLLVTLPEGEPGGKQEKSEAEEKRAEKEKDRKETKEKERRRIKSQPSSSNYANRRNRHRRLTQIST